MEKEQIKAVTKPPNKDEIVRGGDEMSPKAKMRIKPAIRIDGNRRINLKLLRERRQTFQDMQEQDNDRVVQVWRRQEGRDRAAEKLVQEAKAMAKARASKLELVREEVDNPLYGIKWDGEDTNSPTVIREINIRESAVESLYRRGRLTDRQHATGGFFRKLYEAWAGTGAKAFDWMREPVDGGKLFSEPLTEVALRAASHLDSAKIKVGERNFRLLCLVCGEGRAFEEIGAKAEREKATMADNLRNSLDDLAELWGLDRLAQVNSKARKQKRRRA